MTGVATVVHFTDTHLLADAAAALKSTVRPYSAMAAAAAAVAKEVPSPDAILLTGDFTHDDTPEAYRAVADIISDAFGVPPDAAPGVRAPLVLAVPGNHENLDVLEQVFVRERGFTVGLRDRCVAVAVKHWDVLLIDSHVPGEIYGAVSDEKVVWLRAALAHDPGRPKLLALHHPPLTPEPRTADNTWTDMCLRDGRDALLDIMWPLADSDSPDAASKTAAAEPLPGVSREDSTLKHPGGGLRLLLHGHLHMDLRYERRNAGRGPARGDTEPVQLCTPATCHQHQRTNWEVGQKRKHGARVLRLAPDGSVDEKVVWASEAHGIDGAGKPTVEPVDDA